MSGNFWQSSHYQEWILDRQEILLYRKDDLKLFNGNEDDYQKLTIMFANIIQTLGESLKVRQQVIATATVYFKRFYARFSLKCIDPFLMVPTCIFLASKVEEFGLQSQSKLISSISSILKNKYNHAFPQEYPYIIKHVFEAEFFLLEMLDCCLIIYHPYRVLTQLFQQDLPQDDELMKMAWGIVNDSLRTDVSLMYAPNQVALACLHIASVSQNKDLKNWFAELTVDLDKVMEIEKLILHLYELWKGFDEKKEVPAFLAKVPKPNTQGPPAVGNHQHSLHQHPSQSRPSSNGGSLAVKPEKG